MSWKILERCYGCRPTCKPFIIGDGRASSPVQQVQIPTRSQYYRRVQLDIRTSVTHSALHYPWWSHQGTPTCFLDEYSHVCEHNHSACQGRREMNSAPSSQNICSYQKSRIYVRPYPPPHTHAGGVGWVGDTNFRKF